MPHSIHWDPVQVSGRDSTKVFPPARDYGLALGSAGKVASYDGGMSGAFAVGYSAGWPWSDVGENGGGGGGHTSPAPM